MNEKAVQGAGQLIDYGVLGIFCLILLAGFVIAALLIKNNYEKQLREKDALLKMEGEENRELRKELAELRDRFENKLNVSIDQCGDAMHENSKALYEHAAQSKQVAEVMNEVKGVLLSIHELMKNK